MWCHVQFLTTRDTSGHVSQSEIWADTQQQLRCSDITLGVHSFLVILWSLYVFLFFFRERFKVYDSKKDDRKIIVNIKTSRTAFRVTYIISAIQQGLLFLIVVHILWYIRGFFVLFFLFWAEVPLVATRKISWRPNCSPSSASILFAV